MIKKEKKLKNKVGKKTYCNLFERMKRGLKEFFQEFKYQIELIISIILLLLVMGYIIDAFEKFYSDIFLTKDILIPLCILLLIGIIGWFLFLWILNKISFKGNIYVSTAMYLITLTLLIGIFLLRAYFTSDLTYSDNTYRNKFPIDCNSKYNGFVEGEAIKCEINMSEEFKENIITRINILYFDKMGTGISGDNQILRFNKSQFAIPITSKEDTSIDIIFLDKNETRVDSFEINTKDRIDTLKEYKDKELKKLTYFVALISLAIFSVLSGIKNLKDICENTNSKN